MICQMLGEDLGSGLLEKSVVNLFSKYLPKYGRLGLRIPPRIYLFSSDRSVK